MKRNFSRMGIALFLFSLVIGQVSFAARTLEVTGDRATDEHPVSAPVKPLVVQSPPGGEDKFPESPHGIVPGTLVVKMAPGVVAAISRWEMYKNQLASLLASVFDILGLFSRARNKSAKIKIATDISRDMVRKDIESVLLNNGISQSEIKTLFGTPKRPSVATRFTEQYLIVKFLGDEEKTKLLAGALSSIGGVEGVFFDYPVIPFYTGNDTYYPPALGAWGQSFHDLWGFSKIQADKALDITKGAGVTVAVVDTGVDYNHEDLAGSVIKGHDYINNDEDPMDDFGHGTHVAGTIAAHINNGIGIAGVAPEAKILAIKVFNAAGGGATTAIIADAVRAAADANAQVINMSLGGYVGLGDVDASPYMTDAIKYAHDKGTTIVVSAGNSAYDALYYSPANNPNVITVAAFDSQDKKAFFSNTGPKIAVAAPGGGDAVPAAAYQPYRSILSLRAAGAGSSMTGNGQLIIGTNYVRQAGTSMAAPHAAAVAALVKSKNPLFTPEQIRQALETGADDVDAAGFDLNAGYGRLNAFKAVTVASPLAVQITQPTGLAKIVGVGQLPVYGTISGPNLVSWKLEIGVGNLPTSWTQLGSGTTAVDNNLLATANLLTIPDGWATLRLTAVNSVGEVFEYRTAFYTDKTAITYPRPEKGYATITGDQVTITGTVQDPNLINYTLQLKIVGVAGQTFSLPASYPVPKITLANSGTQNVADGILGVWDTSNMPPNLYRLVLTINRSGTGSIIKETGTIILDPTFLKNATVDIGKFTLEKYFVTGFISELTAADIDADGKDEVLMTIDKKVHAINEQGQDLPGWPQSINPSNRTSIVAAQGPVVGDIDGDGLLEIAVGNQAGDGGSGEVFVWSRDGQLLPGWPVAFSDATKKQVGSMTIDTVNKQLLITISKYYGATPVPGVIKAFNITGRELWSRDIGEPVQPATDGKVIAVYSIFDNKLFLLDSRGNILTGWPKTMAPYQGSSNSNYPALADINNDGQNDVVIGSSDESGAINVFDVAGNALPGWPQKTDPASTNWIAVADIDGDAKPEIIANTTSKLYAWHGGGSLLPGWPIQFTGHTGQGFGRPVILDITGDNKSDIIAFTDGGPTSDAIIKSMRAFSYDGKEITNKFPKPASHLNSYGFGSETPAIGDFNNDDKLDLAFYRDDLLYFWELGVSETAEQPWTMFNSDAEHTGALKMVSPLPDVNAPLLSSVKASAITTNSANIEWITDEPATTQVDYGCLTAAVCASKQTLLNTGLVNAHIQSISGLLANTAYYYRVQSKDKAGNLAVSVNYTFTTADVIPPADTTPPVISGVTATDVTASSAIIRWTTNEAATTQIDYGLSKAYGMQFFEARLSTNHIKDLNNLQSDATYYYQVTSKDAAGNTSVSSNQTFKTAKPAPDKVTISRSDWVKSGKLYVIAIQAASSNARNGLTNMMYTIFDKKGRSMGGGTLTWKDSENIYETTFPMSRKPRKWTVEVISNLGGKEISKIIKH